MVPGFGHDFHQGETLHDAEGQRRICAPYQHERLDAQLNLAHGVGHRVSGRGATGGDYVAEAAEAETHAHFAGEHAHGPAGDGEDAYLLDLSLIIKMVLMVGKVISAAAAAQHHADFAFAVEGEAGGINTGIAERLSRGRNGQGYGAGEMLAFVRLDPVKLVEILDFAGNFYRKL